MGILKKTTSGEVELWWGGGWARHLPGQPRIPEHNVNDVHDVHDDGDGGDGGYKQVWSNMFNLLREDRSNCAEGPAGQLPLDSEQNGFLQLSLALQKDLCQDFLL